MLDDGGGRRGLSTGMLSGVCKLSGERMMGVIGCGTMGRGIAHAAAASGFIVRTMDDAPEVVREAYAGIGRELDQRVARGKLSGEERDETVSRLEVAASPDDFAEAECVIEAVPEDMSLKRRVLAELERHVSPRALLATNTSCLSIAKMAEGLRHADRLVGMHFFNPAPVMRLVELIAGPATSERAMVAGRSICAKLNKTAVVVKDSPGFICNRVNRPFYLEAQHLLESGEADIGAIDAAVKDVGGFKMGPFEVMDLVGLDVSQTVTETVYRGFGQAVRFAPSAIQRDLVAQGHLGRKTGRGFYDYSVDGSPTPACEGSGKGRPSWEASSALGAFAAALDRPADRAMWLYARIMLAVIQEAALVAEAVARPRSVDVAMELGLGYPLGPLGLADRVGLDVVLTLLSDFQAANGASERFKPSPLLERHVANGYLGEQSARGFFHHAL